VATVKQQAQAGFKFYLDSFFRPALFLKGMF